MAKGITSRQENYSQWYLDIVNKAGLASNSQVRGCMVIKPNGYAIWENIQQVLDKMFKDTGHQNAYFPIFIPKSNLSKEAEHVDGFAKECAVVTHHRLKVAEDGSGVVVDPEAKLEEELIVRPTSETIIWATYKDWIQSYRDLPILINQWANVVRWEMRTRPFLRTTEFLWQEGHTAHATREEAIGEAEQMHRVYAEFAEKYMAMPVIMGRKSESERFAGAEETYTIEAMMQDGRALQAGTSHFLGQNFAKTFDVTFMDSSNEEQYVWATSWGVSTRLVGALIMTHSDDDGLIIPPRLARNKVVIVPIPQANPEMAEVADRIIKELADRNIRAIYDGDENKRPGFKFAQYELEGIPVRIGLGKRELDNGMIEVARRDTKEKMTAPLEGIGEYIENLLEEIQDNLFKRAYDFRKSNTREVSTWEEFKDVLENKGGFLIANWDGTTETEEKIQEETKATIRCIPLKGSEPDGNCIYSGKEGKYKVIFAKAY